MKKIRYNCFGKKQGGINRQSIIQGGINRQNIKKILKKRGLVLNTDKKMLVCKKKKVRKEKKNGAIRIKEIKENL